MRNKYHLLSILLALMLVGNNVAFSGHVSSHAMKDSGLCSLCVNPGGSDNAITAEPATFFVLPTARVFNQGDILGRLFSLILHAHQSRAPPASPEMTFLRVRHLFIGGWFQNSFHGDSKCAPQPLEFYGYAL